MQVWSVWMIPFETHGWDTNWVAVLAIGVIACITDLRARRIPNVLTFGAAAAGLCCQVWTLGLSGVLHGAGGWLLGVAIFLPLFLLRSMGGGDVKLMGALGAWLGARDVFWVALYAALAGGVMAVVVALWHRRLRLSVGNVGMLLWYWRSVGVKPLPELTLEASQGPRLAYAFPILAGVVLRMWFLA